MERTTRLTKVFHDVLYGNRPISNKASGHLFLEALVSQDQKVSTVVKLITIKNGDGLKAVQKSFWFTTDKAFLNGLATSVLEYFNDPDVKQILGGQYLRDVLKAMVDPPIFWTAFHSAFFSDLLDVGSQRQFTWLLLELVLLPGDDGAPYLEIANNPALLQRLLASTDPETRSLGEKLKHVLSSNVTVNEDGELEYMPGGRHDNDFPDYRKISILPTADELKSKEAPFLRPAASIDDPDNVDQRLGIYLDNQFRLLREDMLGEMRDELQIAQGFKKGRHRGARLDGLMYGCLDFGHEDQDGNITSKDRRPWGIRFVYPPGFQKLRNNSNVASRKKAIKDDRKFLPHNSFSCLLHNNEVVAFPTISRDEELLIADPPLIVLRIGDSKEQTLKVLEKLKSSMGPKFTMIQIDTAVFAYEPVLRRLQKIKELTLAREILYWEPGQTISAPPKPPTLIIDGIQNTRGDLKDLFGMPKSVLLDDSQRQSLLAGLNQRVSLIQGPPGTGKSFIGALLTKILYEHTKKRILIATFTNHALDTFLEDLLANGVPPDAITRLGGRASPSVDHLVLHKQAKIGRFNKEHFNMVRAAEAESRTLDMTIRQDISAYLNTSIAREALMEHLEFDDPAYFQAFQVPMSKDGMTMVGRRGRAVDRFYLMDQWLNNSTNPVKVIGQAAYEESQEIWQMSFENRKIVAERWTRALLSESCNKLATHFRQYDELQTYIQSLWNAAHERIIAQKRIIACTTTGAAKYVNELHRASPQVMLVEEAGEILESHVITALGSKTEQLILIGDHKQLRPKVNNYSLTIEKGDGYNLNCSMFERLVRKGFPHQALTKQHRMRPEISSLIRQLDIYPDLEDAPGTKNRPDVRGFQDNVIFVNHDHDEDENKKFKGGLNENGHKSSKQNSHEADMVLNCVRYLGQQGYGTKDLVILTPYLGQLSLLREKLSKTMDPILNDLDNHDLILAGLMLPSAAKLDRKSIRLATIDNYQGEEADIVVVSLTRSNPSCDIGFLFSPERLNVLLSRARNGLILIGNASTFAGSKKGGDLWKKLFRILGEGKHMYEGFPLVCQQHEDRKVTAVNPKDFETLVPDGGCLESCGAMLNCTIHKCPRRCHRLADHSEMRCQTIMQDSCPKGHTKTYKCWEPTPTGCSACDREAKALADKQARDYEAQKKREALVKLHLDEMAKIQEQLDREREEQKEKQADAARAVALAQKKKELQDIKDAAEKKAKQPARKSPPPIVRPKSGIAQAVNAAVTALGGFGSAATGGPSENDTVSEDQNSVDGDSSCCPTPDQSDSEGSKPDLQDETQHEDFVNLGDNAANKEWERQKDFEGASNADIDALMELIGLEEVKDQVLRIKGKIDVAIRQGTDVKDQRFSVSMLGNPGTGKTTVARLYAKILRSLDVLTSPEFIETTGASLANDGVKGAKDIMEKLKNAGGGALFVDEAYQLADSRNFGGYQVLKYILAEIENNRNCVFLFAGYSREMEKFFEANPGIPSRVPYKLRFEDYKNYDLLDILQRRIGKKFNNRMKIQGGMDGLYMRIFIRRIAAMRGRPGFGNARAIENAFDKLMERQATRLQEERRKGRFPDDYYFTKEDLIGPNPSKKIISSDAWKTMQKMIGLQSVKDSISAMIDRIETNYHRELQEQPPLVVSLNRVFLGSPGTGKTTVAKLYGSILVDLGLLSNGEVIVKNPADFTGSALGESEKNTKGILESTKGKVLVIDEFYGLYSNGGGIGNQSDPYKTAVIDTIVAEVQSVPGEDRCVLLCGYEEQMRDMFDNVNPGLARRFAMDDAFKFEDFTKEELGKILDLKLKSAGLKATPEARETALDVLERAKSRSNFGNGGEVENLLSRAKTNFQTRQSKMLPKERPTDVIFQPQDFDKDFARGKNAATNIKELFKDVVGHAEVIKKLEGYQKMFTNLKALGRDPRDHIPMNFVFKGPPGTGKTTTARKIGQVFYDMGMLASTEVVDCTATDLVGQYVGQTGPKAQKQLEKGLGKVLFIDEAYRLADGAGGFAKEAVNELVDALTKPKFMGKMIVILAGYDQDMNKLMAVNSGLSSRFPTEVVFHNMVPADCISLLAQDLLKQGISVDGINDHQSQVYLGLQNIFDAFSLLPSWGNGRDVKTLAKSLVGVVFNSDSPTLTLSTDEVLSCAQTMLDERKSRATNLPADTPADLSSMMQSPPSPPPPTAPAPPKTRIKTTVRTAPPEPVQTKTEATAPPQEIAQEARDPGVSDSDWAALQAAKQRQVEEEAARELEIQKAQEKLRRLAAESERLRLEEIKIQKMKDDEERRRRTAEVQMLKEIARKKQEEIERRKKAEETKKQEEARKQAKLRSMGVCPAGFQWTKMAGGYQCGGGSHWVSDAQLR